MANVEYKNASGYPDPTAQKGLKPLVRDENKVENDKKVLIKMLQSMAHLAGFEIVGRVVVKHKNTGRMFK